MNMSNKTDYLMRQFNNDRLLYNQQSTIKTGLQGLDDHISIRPGLYLLGGCPGVGKTSLILQLADTFAMHGHRVLFFNLEQSEYDLTRKSLNRIAHQNEINEQQAIDRYLKHSDNITTISVGSRISDAEITAAVNDYVEQNKCIPIVFVDYLQKIDVNGVSSKKDIVEHVSATLVNIVKKHHLTMFVLSSLNRANYNSQIDFESFKESGNLEYDADVVFGLQYQVIGEDAFINNSSIDRKRLMMNEAKTSDVRKVELVCLKNRHERIAPKCKLNYFPDQDLFVDMIQKDDGAAKRNVCKF